jgi:hypothetical protein
MATVTMMHRLPTASTNAMMMMMTNINMPIIQQTQHVGRTGTMVLRSVARMMQQSGQQAKIAEKTKSILRTKYNNTAVSTLKQPKYASEFVVGTSAGFAINFYFTMPLYARKYYLLQE